MTDFNWDRVQHSKREWQQKSARLSLTEKFALLDELRMRTQAMRAATWVRSKETIPSPRRPAQDHPTGAVLVSRTEIESGPEVLAGQGPSSAAGTTATPSARR